MRKPALCIYENKGADQLCSTLIIQLISVFVFATWTVHSFNFLNLKFQALTIFCGHTARIVSVGLVGYLKAGFLAIRLIKSPGLKKIVFGVADCLTQAGLLCSAIIIAN